MNRQQFIIDRFNIDTSKPGPYFIKLSRWKELPYLLGDMGFTLGAEIGVEQGRFADCLLRKMPDLFLYAIDCWEPYPGYREKMGDRITEYERKCRERLEGKNCKIIKAYSMDAVQSFGDESLDFVYIDGNHEFQQVTNDISEWSKKVRKGGLIMGHDYTVNNVGYERTDVKLVVDAYVEAYGIKTWFVTSEGDKAPSWLWVKQ